MDIDLDRRKFHIRNAIASFALEGEHPSPYFADLLEKFGNGEIKTMEELKDMLLKEDLDEKDS
ncbi:antitoxin VbhA family protein [[Pasteurella] aerogenes]